MEVPQFDRSDLDGWVFRIEEFFHFHGTHETLRLHIVSFHMEGRTAAWYKWMKANNLFTTWKDFLVKLKNRFRPSLFEDHQGALSKLIQSSSVAEFQFDFENLMSKVIGISEPLLISFFITGLKPEIRKELLFSQPSTCMETFVMARAYEAHKDEAHQDHWSWLSPSPKPWSHGSSKPSILVPTNPHCQALSYCHYNTHQT